MTNSEPTQISSALRNRPAFERFYIFTLLAFLSFCAADLSILYERGAMLPTKAPPTRPQHEEKSQMPPRSEYESIVSRDPFNSDHVIPKALNVGAGGLEGEPVPTSLPLTLLGTIVNSDPSMSVATIAISSKKVRPYQMGQKIGDLAKVVKIQRMKVIFTNLENGRLEYIQIKEKQFLTLAVNQKVPGIQVQGNNITISHEEVTKNISNLNQILNQASAQPDWIPGSGGQIDGYKLVNIQPGSIFEKLGLRRFDVIKSVNGEPVNSTAKAMELYNQLRNSNQIAIGIERNGSDQTLNYTITQ